MRFEVHVITPEGEHHLAAEPGETLYACLAGGGIVLDTPCGGHCFCGKCRVKVSPMLPALEGEKRFLSEEELKAGLRLACAVKVDRDLTVTVAGSQGQASILTEGSVRGLRVAHGLRRVTLQLDPGTLDDQRGDAERLEAALPCRIPLTLLRRLPELARREGGKVTAVLDGDRLLDLTGGDPVGPLAGLAVDIGTTTVVAYLLNLETGAQLGAESAMNPQKLHGDDVITRIQYAAGGREALEELHTAVIGCINTLTEKICASIGMDPARIVRASIAGNTVMMHLFLGVSPEHIAAAPFISAFTRDFTVRAADVGLCLAAEAEVTALPSVAGYVGADITAGILASGMNEAEELTLLVDIGTNGEMVLGNRDRLVACSTAAGPALEGAHISCGMSALTGAVSHLTVRGEDVEAETIGGAEPRGLCGSGLVDTVAVLLKAGAMDETGRMDPDEAPESWEDRFLREGRSWSFCLTDETHPVVLTQKDIREVQLAKGAVAAGIRVLAEQYGVPVGDIRKVCLAGGFGNYIDIDSACRIGLLPSELNGRIVGIGNSAGDGAKMTLLDDEQRAAAAGIARNTRYIELSAVPEFTDLFAEEMMFEEE